MISVPFSSLAAMCTLMKVPYRSAARAHIPGPHHDFSRHLLLKESLDNVVLAVRAAHQSGLSVFCMLSLCLTASNEHLVDPRWRRVQGFSSHSTTWILPSFSSSIVCRVSYASARRESEDSPAFWIVLVDTGYQHHAEAPLSVKNRL